MCMYGVGALLFLLLFLWMLSDRHLVTLDWEQRYSVVLYQVGDLDFGGSIIKYEVTKAGKTVLPKRVLGYSDAPATLCFRLIEAGDTGVVALIVTTEVQPCVVLELFDFAHPDAIHPPGADAVDRFWKAIPDTRLFIPRNAPGDPEILRRR